MVPRMKIELESVEYRFRVKGKPHEVEYIKRVADVQIDVFKEGGIIARYSTPNIGDKYDAEAILKGALTSQKSKF